MAAVKRNAADGWELGMLLYLALAIPVAFLIGAAIMRWAPHP